MDDKAGGINGNNLLPLFCVTIFISSALLFWIQPLFTKSVLPVLGGSPSVWNTSMVCFQILLLAGYFYADRLTSVFSTKSQFFIHFLVILLSLYFIYDFSFNFSGKFDAHINPIFWQLSQLFYSIGIPFFLLSTTSTLLQRWYSAISLNKDVYWLYSLSNAGSMLGVLGFIILIEPYAGLAMQGLLLKLSFALFSVLLVFCSWFYLVRSSLRVVRQCTNTDGGSSAAEMKAELKIDWRQKLRWILLAAVPSALLLAATTHVTMEIAPVPLIWMLILALYLISYMLAFASWKKLSFEFFLKAQMFLCLPLLFDFFLDILSATGISMMLWHMAAFFVTATICHRILYESRPPAGKLTTFYLYLSVGGAVGGIFVTFIAPLLFNSLLEYPLLFALAFMLRPSEVSPAAMWKKDLAMGAALLGVLAGIFLLFKPLLYPFNAGMTGLLLALGFFVVKLCFDQEKRPLRLGFFYMAAVLAGIILADIRGERAEEIRNFYGIISVDRSDPEVFGMTHGTTVHGIQYIDKEKYLTPLAYFHPSGPLGDLMKAFFIEKPQASVAIIGLGVGSMACYGRSGDKFTFYEINPAVADLANNTRYFSYLKDCPPEVEIIEGDGRIKLEAEKRNFDLFILDAFTSDAIPVHLLTKEAFSIYRSHLKEGGLIFVHISNRYLDLSRVVGAIAKKDGMEAKIFADKDSKADKYKQPSTWVVMGKDSVVAELNLPSHWRGIRESDNPAYLWSDDYSNILSLMLPQF